MATNGIIRFKLPPPCILKPKELWSGKQLVNCLINPSSDFPRINVSLIQKEKNYDSELKAEHFDLREGYVMFQNGELLCGRIGKNTLGGNK